MGIDRSASARSKVTECRERELSAAALGSAAARRLTLVPGGGAEGQQTSLSRRIDGGGVERGDGHARRPLEEAAAGGEKRLGPAGRLPRPAAGTPGSATAGSRRSFALAGPQAGGRRRPSWAKPLRTHRRRPARDAADARELSTRARRRRRRGRAAALAG